MGIHVVEGSQAKGDGRQDENGDGSFGARMTQYRPPKAGGEERWTLYESEKTEYKSPQKSSSMHIPRMACTVPVPCDWYNREHATVRVCACACVRVCTAAHFPATNARV